MNEDKGVGAQAKTPFWRNPWVIAAVGGMLFLTVLRATQEARKSAPPPLLSPGAWELVDQDGQPFGSEQLKGKVWIASFFFTRCPSICPALMKKMKEVHGRFEGQEDKVHFVSFTVDPEYDQPPILSAYRNEKDMAAANWSFVTGKPESVHGVLVKQLKQGIGKKTPINSALAKDPDPAGGHRDHGEMDHSKMDHGKMDHGKMDHGQGDGGAGQNTRESFDPNKSEALFDISHQARFALFDQNGDLRGFFETKELVDLAQLVASAKLFVEQGPNP
jgi:cytochrome oxidase Cu insertion factor (SCO1/SenC/PrrC family)